MLWWTVAPLVLALWARSKVTPVADPRADDGTPLVLLGEEILEQDVIDPEPAVTAVEFPAVYPPPVAATVEITAVTAWSTPASADETSPIHDGLAAAIAAATAVSPG